MILVVVWFWDGLICVVNWFCDELICDHDVQKYFKG